MGVIAGLVAFGLAFATRTHGTSHAPVRSPTGLQTHGASFELHPAAARLSVRSRDGALNRELDLALVRCHLEAFPRICVADPTAGPISQLSQRERFHWLVSPRSTIIQVSPVHTGLCDAPADLMDNLTRRYLTL